MRTERSRPDDLAVGELSCDDGLGRDAVLDPVLEDGKHVERAWTETSAAVVHARSEVQPCE
jgi:hypothetical protein